VRSTLDRQAIRPRPRIGIFFPSLAMGGVERLMVTLSRALAARGYPIDLVVGSQKGDFRDDVPPSVRVIDLRCPPPQTLLRLPGLVRYLRCERPHVLLSATDGSNLVALWAKLLAQTPGSVVISTHLLWSMHAMLSSFQSPFNAVKYRFVMPVLIQRTYPLADGIIAVSRRVASDIVQASSVPLDRVHVVYNPIITPELRAKMQEPLEHPWFGPGEPPVILGVGRLSREKDFATLIRAFALARQQCPLRLMILGEGAERPALTALASTLGIADDVAMPGFVSNPYPPMREAAVLVLSSFFEGFGNVLVEAMAAGTPVVCTRCPGGPEEILENGTYGRLVPVGDASAMAAAMLATLDAPHPAAVLQRRAEDFSLEKSVDQYLHVLLPDGPDERA
jgi:glycosyltransferase involved in cell wall biosynthesis